MKQAQQMETPGERKLCLGSLAVGTLGAGLALWAIKVDATNNYHFGLEYAGEEAGQLLVLAAAALAIVPMLAMVIPTGWDRFLRIVFWASVIATVIAAVNAYGVKQGAAIDAAKGANDRYEQAQQDRAQARRDLAEAKAETAAIAETVPAAELQKLYDDAKYRRDTEANDPKRGAKCGELCRKAEADMNAYSPRIATARAKEIALARADKAQARIDAAKVESKDGPKEQQPIAKAIASWTGTTAEDAAGKIALVMAVMMITISVSAGLIFDHSFQAIRKGFGFGYAPAEEMKVARAPKATRSSRPLILAGLSTEERLDQFIKTEALPVLARQPLSSQELYALLEQWWIHRLPGTEVPGKRTLAARMARAGLSSVKHKGRMVHGASLAKAA